MHDPFIKTPIDDVSVVFGVPPVGIIMSILKLIAHDKISCCTVCIDQDLNSAIDML